MSSAVEQHLLEGFQQTEFGLIPDDWVILTVDNLVVRGWLQKPMDGNHGNIHPKSGDFVDHGVPFVMANNVKNGSVDLNGCSFITKEQADSLQKGFAKSGDVLLTHKATIGNTAVVPDISCDYIMLTPQVTYYRVLDAGKIANLYLRHYMDGDVFQSILESLAGGGTRSYIGITAQRKLPIILPSLNEQTEIANALSDVDALITSLEILIAKKRDIKTAAMQQLLTGKTRLPPFDRNQSGTKKTDLGDIPEDWEATNIAKFADCLDYLRVPLNESQRSKMIGDIPYCGANGVVGSVDDFVVDDDIILIAEDGGYFDEFATRPIAYRMIGKCWVNNHAHILKAKEEYSQSFLFYTLVHKDIQKHLASGTRAKLNKSELEKITFMAPATRDEQEAIGEVFESIDNEIDLLEERLNKSNQLKVGMMQELLTGRTRLI